MIVREKGKKLIKRIGLTGIVLFILTTSTLIFFSLKWKPILKDTISSTIFNASSGLYQVKFSDIKLNLFAGKIYVDSIEFIPDTILYKKMVKEKTAPENLFYLKIKQFSIKNAHPFKVYFKKEIDIEDIIIEQPKLIIAYTKLNNKVRILPTKRSLYENIKENLNSIKLDKLILRDIEFTYIDRSLVKPEVVKIDKLNLQLKEILIDSAAVNDTSRFLYTKDISVGLTDFNYPTADSLYYINFSELNISTQLKTLEVNNFEIQPRYPEMAFSNLFKHKKERYDLKFEHILLNQINFHQLLTSRTLKAKNLDLTNGVFSIFLNRGKPALQLNKPKIFPHMTFKNLNWQININNINIFSSDVYYSEFAKETERRGTIPFTNLNGKISNVTNDSTLLSKNKIIKADINANVFGQGELHSIFNFDMLDKNGSFTFKGNLKNLPLKNVNATTKPLAKATFGNGTLNNMFFDIAGNLDEAKGQLKIEYNDLHINLMQKEATDMRFKKLGLASVIVNALLIKSDNPSKGEALRVVYPHYKRPNESSFFNLMWKVIFVGFKESVGYTQEKQDQILLKAQQIKNSFNNIKSVKQKRKNNK